MTIATDANPTRLPLALALAGLALAGPAAAATAPDVPAAVRRASELFARDAGGVMAHLAVAESTLAAPLLERRFADRLWIANVDARPTRARVLAFLQDGQPVAEPERARHEREVNAAYRRGDRGFAAPYDAHHLADYVITPTACVGCAAGEQAFAFRSAQRDPTHGDGAFVIDAAHHVVRVSYRPASMPKGASTGEMELLRSAIPGFGWSLTQVRARFTGGIGPVQGSYTLAQHMSGHRRFATVEQAMAAAPK